MTAPESDKSFATTQPVHQYIKLLSDHEKQSNSNPNLSYVRTIILKSLSDPAVYTGFNELKNALQLPPYNIENSTAGQLLLRTLDLFSYGCYLDYKSVATDDTNADADANAGGTFVKLNEAQETKLKLLTIVTVVQQTLEKMGKNEDHVTSASATTTTSTIRMNRRNRRHQKVEPVTNTLNKSKSTNHKCAIVQYSTLQSALGTDEERSKEENKNRILENLLIKCIYTNLLPTGTKLDQKNACLVVKTSSPISSSSQGAAAGTSSSSSTTSTPSTAADPSTGAASNAATGVPLCRDINVGTDIPDMISKLETMYNRSEKVKAHLMESLNELNRGMKCDVEKWKQVEESIQLAKDKVKERKQSVGDAAATAAEGRAGGTMAMMVLSELGQRMSSKSGNLKRSRGGKA
mmetsp:Transcript_24780/g.37000  ORF Transcript_24780/g.37000 Transcript_24780/m.37000 type:complete len:406 (+) Transcript_24780:70-1287(+)